jgi:two-component system, OmpR family, sensor histidine kinase CiaH
MFKKLRNRFMILNLVIISVMMLIAFTAIYTITHQNVQTDIDMELRRISEFHEKGANGPRDRMPPGVQGADIEKGGGPRQFPNDRSGRPMEERSVSFAIETNSAWELTSVNSLFTSDEAFFREAMQTALAKNRDRGHIQLDGYDWAYEIRPFLDGYRLIFLDVTARQDILRNLVYTFLAVGLLMFVVIFFISRFFANRSIAPIRDAFEKQKQFIADASHELKTPLAVINTNADVLLANEDDTIRNQVKWVRYIQAETERMSKLTGDLLYLTQMEEARETMMFAPFSASEAAEIVILTMEAVIFERSLSLDYDIEPGISVMGNHEQFKQVVMILLDNAIKYANTEGSIRLQLGRQHHETVLTVTNTGEGIAPEHLDRIFDRFYRTDPSRVRAGGGYGLGLAIAKAIVEQHHGEIKAKSIVNDTTTFTVKLPMLP